MDKYKPPFPQSLGDQDGFEIDLGSRPNIGLQGQETQVLDLPTAFEMVVDSCKRDPAMAQRLIAMIGIDALETAKSRRAPVRMPLKGIRAIECSIAYSPSRAPNISNGGKVQRVRPERAKLDYYVSIQIFGPRSKGLSDPVWKGAAQLRDPIRAAKDARSRERKTSLSEEYAKWIEDVIVPVAHEHDMLIGFLMDKRKGEGTYFHEFQIILVDRAALQTRKLNSASILSIEPDGQTRVISLPEFVSSTGTGKPLSGPFILQSRGIIRPGERDDWATGLLKV